MVTVANQVLKGLLEGLVLLSIERDPTHGYGILKDFEDLLGEAPNKNQVYPLLSRLEEDGLILSEEVEEGSRTRQVYHLTEEGQAHLDEFRALPPAFKHRLVDLFGIPSEEELAHALEATGHVEELERLQEEDRAPQPRPAPAREAPAGAGWVREHLAELPRGPRVEAPFAQVSLDRSPREGQWRLTVDQHEPGNYEGAGECPLTFLYLAAQRLLFDQPDAPR